MIEQMLFVAVIVGLLPGMAAADAKPPADFRIENQVFVGKKKEPAAKSTTIFYRGVVYDFLAAPAEVTIYDPAENRFILLDLDRKLKTELGTGTIEKMLKRITKLAAKSKDPKIQFLYHPMFRESFDKKTGELVLEADPMTYRVKGEATGSEDLARQYRRFSDAYAKLNTYLRPGSRPPFARLIVNEALEKRKEIPKEIVLILKMHRGLKLRPDTLRSEHRLIKRLLESDHRRIKQAGEQMAKFKAVGFREYEARARKDSAKK
jgi:hypothetical protein